MSQINDANSLSNRSDAAGRFNQIERADKPRRPQGPAAPANRPIASPPAQPAAEPKQPGRAGDSLELSSAASERPADLASRIGPDRAARIEQIRTEINEERYLTDERLDTALDRLVSDFQGWTGRLG